MLRFVLFFSIAKLNMSSYEHHLKKKTSDFWLEYGGTVEMPPWCGCIFFVYFQECHKRLGEAGIEETKALAITVAVGFSRLSPCLNQAAMAMTIGCSSKGQEQELSLWLRSPPNYALVIPILCLHVHGNCWISVLAQISHIGGFGCEIQTSSFKFPHIQM